MVDGGENWYNSRIVKFGAKVTRGFDPRMQQYFFLLFCIYVYGDGTTTKILKVRQKNLGFQIRTLAEAAIQKKGQKKSTTPMDTTV
jgi:hypothetical protein